jgi:hypothetical protein
VPLNYLVAVGISWHSLACGLITLLSELCFHIDSGFIKSYIGLEIMAKKSSVEAKSLKIFQKLAFGYLGRVSIFRQKI